MKPIFYLVLITLFFGGPGTSVQAASKVDRLATLVQLSPEQRELAAQIFAREDAAFRAATENKKPGAMFQAAENAIREIRAMLTPSQRAVYDHTPSARGGGLNLATPEERVKALDREVGLSGEQRKVALQVFTEEYESLAALAPEEREAKGLRFRNAANDQIRSLLTAAQVTKREDAAEAALARWNDEGAAIEKAVRECPGVTARVGQILAIQRNGRSARMDKDSRTGEARLQVTGDRSALLVVVSWECRPKDSPLTITKLATPSGELLSR